MTSGILRRRFCRHGPYGFTRMRYRGLARCRLHFDLAAIACNLRRATA